MNYKLRGGRCFGGGVGYKKITRKKKPKLKTTSKGGDVETEKEKGGTPPWPLGSREGPSVLHWSIWSRKVKNLKRLLWVF